MESDELIHLVEAHHSSYQEDLAYWLGLANQSEGPILELGCGTGRIFLPLYEAGLSVYGLDYDPAAFHLLQERVKRAGGDPGRVILADITSFQLPVKFGLIFCPCNTFSTLKEPERALALDAIFHHLAPGGCFAASIPNPDLLFDLRSQPGPVLEGDFRHPLSGDPVQVSSSYLRRGNIFTLTWYYDHLLPEGHITRATVQVEHEIQSFASYQTQLKAAGLEITQAWGDFDRSSYSVESPNLIWEATTGRE
jgi:SAM-dependent methyltransferase